MPITEKYTKPVRWCDHPDLAAALRALGWRPQPGVSPRVEPANGAAAQLRFERDVSSNFAARPRARGKVRG